MEFDLTYSISRGMYLLNGTRVLLFPRGSLETIQDYVNGILGLATKSLLRDAMQTAVFSLLTDFLKSGKLKKTSPEKMFVEIADLLSFIGFGKFKLMTRDFASFDVIIESNSNSILRLIKPMNYCFLSEGVLNAISQAIFGKASTIEESACRSAGDSDVDKFKATFTNQQATFNYVSLGAYNIDPKDMEHIKFTFDGVSTMVNDIPVEIIPITFLPYFFSRLRSIIGVSVYGLEYGMAEPLARLFPAAQVFDIKSKYGLRGVEALSPVMGVGRVTTVLNEQGNMSEIQVYDSFNALHVDNQLEKRCSLLSGLLSFMSFKLAGYNMSLKESGCQAVNNTYCSFIFG